MTLYCYTDHSIGHSTAPLEEIASITIACWTLA